LHIFIRAKNDLDLDAFMKRCHASDEILYRILRDNQGSVSAEHGVGLLKKHALGFTRSPEEIRWMKEFKKVLDPKHLLNPEKVI
jgi:FAD/FMN-containing dehydrogenase